MAANKKRHDKRPDVEDFQISYCFGMGWSPWEIAKRFHCSSTTVIHRLQRMGFMVKPYPLQPIPEKDPYDADIIHDK